MTAALLLAEPEPAIRGYLERQLQSDGFHVLQAAFGGEALALAERTRPDLVLCSELELCARLREGEPGRIGAPATDRTAGVVTVSGENVHLAEKEFELLAALAAEPHRVFTKDELLRDVWGYRSFTRTRTLDSHVSRLRGKLERDSGDRFVVNIWGVGYKLVD